RASRVRAAAVRKRIAVASTLALLLAAGAALAQGDGARVPLLPLLPPLWHTGDTHAHIQLCSDTPVADLTVSELYQMQKVDELEVTCAQIWGQCAGGLPDFIANYVPLVTGVENPVSAADPGSIVQFGVEASKFKASPFGHVHGWGIATGVFPYEAAYPEP